MLLSQAMLRERGKEPEYGYYHEAMISTAHGDLRAIAITSLICARTPSGRLTWVTALQLLSQKDSDILAAGCRAFVQY